MWWRILQQKFGSVRLKLTKTGSVDPHWKRHLNWIQLETEGGESKDRLTGEIIYFYFTFFSFWFHYKCFFLSFILNFPNLLFEKQKKIEKRNVHVQNPDVSSNYTIFVAFSLLSVFICFLFFHYFTHRKSH